MAKNIKKSTVAGATGVFGAIAAATSTGATVIGSSAATIMAGTAGTAGATIAGTAGAVGLSGGAATASGMAAVGSVVGGGMATGAIITAASPFLAVGAVGYGIFKFFED